VKARSLPGGTAPEAVRASLDAALRRVASLEGPARATRG
jgi:hypothetical protein